MAEHVMDDPASRPQRFGWPVVLAVGVHALLLVAPALDLRSSRSAPEEPLMVQVDLVEPPSILEAPAPVLPQPVPVSPVPIASQTPKPVEQIPPEPDTVIEPMTTAAAEAPKAPAPVAQPTGVEAEPARALRDTTAESGAIRTRARLGDNPRPDYPRSAREAGWEGTVILHVDVLENGMAGAVLVHKTSGHTALDSAALSAVQKWKFVPAMDGAFPVRSVVYLPVQFDLRTAR